MVNPAQRSDALEVSLLQEALALRWGLDFRRWRGPTFRRRVRAFSTARGLLGPADLVPLVLRDEAWKDALVADLARREDPLFRDPATWLVLRQRVIPLLRTWPRVRWWLPGTGSAADLWSLAVLLEEEGLTARSHVWVTGISEAVLAEVRGGGWPGTDFARGAANHRHAGGRMALEERALRDGTRVRLPSTLLPNVSFARHHLEAEGTHNEFHAILCRNVLLDFDPSLTARAHETLHQSLVPFGTVVFGRHERFEGTPVASSYVPVNAELGIWRRRR